MSAVSVDAKFSEHYAELRRLAHMRLHRDGGGFALETTALVNECYLKLRSIESLVDAERTHFMAYASRTMRSIIVDLVREQLALRRGGDMNMVTLNTEIAENTPDTKAGKYDVLQIHEALNQLEQLEPRLAQVVELRYFGGLTFEEMSETMQLNERTIRRDWDKAKLLLLVMLQDEA
ncbi:MAG: sigma-70 family RNA polymerase sigma factor [Betaproteobacteria bacterium]|nr:MAG: sigma-70 family RNA polymerase sigma factor [Betaproteobacteria bacterium]